MVKEAMNSISNFKEPEKLVHMVEPGHHARQKSPESPQNWGRTVGMDFENKLENKTIKKGEGNYLKNPPSDIAL